MFPQQCFLVCPGLYAPTFVSASRIETGIGNRSDRNHVYFQLMYNLIGCLRQYMLLTLFGLGDSNISDAADTKNERSQLSNRLHFEKLTIVEINSIFACAVQIIDYYISSNFIPKAQQVFAWLQFR